jgi:hypothetical protein
MSMMCEGQTLHLLYIRPEKHNAISDADAVQAPWKRQASRRLEIHDQRRGELKHNNV